MNTYPEGYPQILHFGTMRVLSEFKLPPAHSCIEDSQSALTPMHKSKPTPLMTLKFKTFETFFRMGRHTPTNRRARKRTLGGVLLAFSLLVTVFASLQVKQDIEQAAVRQFSFICDQITLKIQNRLGYYGLILHGGDALFAASVSVERKEWQAYVENLHSVQSVPGMQGLGFAQIIPADQLTAHVAKIRSEGFFDYTVKPPGERAIYTSIIYLEPFRDRNLRAFGYDMYTEPVRRAAMEQARDTGEAALSGKVELVQETGTDVQAGVLMYVPVYRNGAPISTVEQRRSALVGWVYSPYRMNDLMTGILADWMNHEGKIVNLAIYDGREATPASLLFDNQPDSAVDAHSLFYQQRTIAFNGHQWLLVLDRTGQLSAIDFAPAWAVLAGGLALSGLLFGLLRSVINTQANAERIAKGLTTEIKRAQEKIHLLLNSTAEAIYGIDMKGDCTFCNNACLSLLGYQHPDDLLGKNMHWQIHGKYADGTHFPVEECRIFQAFNKGERMHVDDEVLWRSDGTSFAAEYWSYPEIDKGVVVGAVVTFLDITERKRLEEVILNQFAIIETYEGLVALADLDGKLIYINTGGTKLLGATQAEEILPKNMTDLLEPTDFKRVTDEALPVAVKDRVWKGEYTLKRIDGTRIPVSQTVFPIHDAVGNLRHIGMIITDISLQKAMQEKLLISEKLAVMGRLVADVSHELNNPLAVIIGRTQLMLSQSDGQQLSLKGQLETVLQNAQRCKTILSNLLTYSRTIGKQEIAVNLPDLIKEALDAVTYQYDMSTLEVAVVCNLPAYTKITGNKDALLSVFVNLIRNARQAMVQTGKLTITITMENESQLRIEIHDTGIGISKVRLEKIFQPFNSGWQQDKGTGLGLITSQGIIETHGGKLWAESAGEGQGAKFIILLPHSNRKTQAINGLEG